ncbi:MAG: hypothetical protein ACFHWZ_14600 [Phycisphaerales bacterium]
MSHGASSNSIGLSASRFLGVEATADQPAKLLGLRDDPRSWQAAEIGRALSVSCIASTNIRRHERPRPTSCAWLYMLPRHS